MTRLGIAAFFTLFGILLASLAGPVSAAPDKTFGMAMMFASVQTNGQLIGGAGAVDAESFTTGGYTVTFERSVAGCAYLATQSFGIGSISPPAVSGEARIGFQTAPVTNDPAKIVVTARVTSSQALAITSFHLFVFCPK